MKPDSGKHRIIRKIKTHRRINRFITFICFMAIVSGLMSFLLFGFYASSGIIKFVAKYKNDPNLHIEKVMINPHIKFEHVKNDYYTVKAQKAIHKNNDQILLIGVEADGSSANIKAGKLVISENGDNLTFTENPVLIIKKKPN